MAKVFCPRCGTGNEEEYRFCKNCGTALPKIEEKPMGDTCRASYRQAENAAYQPQFTEPAEQYAEQVEYCNDSAEQATVLIGKNYGKYSKKFTKMDQKNKKVSWNWAVFLLGLLYVPFAWFIYRKVKPLKTFALIFSIFIIVANLVMTSLYVITFSTAFFEYLKPYTSLSEDYTLLDDYDIPFGAGYGIEVDDYDDYYEYFGDYPDVDELIEDERFKEDMIAGITAGSDASKYYLLGAVAVSVLNLVYVIILAMFADYAYKKNVEEKLSKYRERSDVTVAEIRKDGRLKTGLAAALGIAIPVGLSVFTTNVISVIIEYMIR